LQSLVKGGIQSQAINLGTGHGYSVREVIDAAKRITGREFKVRVSARRGGDPPELVGAVDRAKKVLGWTAGESDLDRIVETAWQWACRIRH
jgi:UDP-glucose 4-epimerase